MANRFDKSGQDRGTVDRIDLAINERGASAVQQKLYQLASTLQKLSPATARSLRGEALRMGINLSKAIEDVACVTLEKVVHGTPHDTGQARANWVTAIRAGRPPSDVQFGKTDYEGDATIAEGQAIIKSTPRPDGHSIWISNSLPYIKALDEGWSGQAPAGMTALALQAGRQAAANVKVLK